MEKVTVATTKAGRRSGLMDREPGVEEPEVRKL